MGIWWLPCAVNTSFNLCVIWRDPGKNISSDLSGQKLYFRKNSGFEWLCINGCFLVISTAIWTWWYFFAAKCQDFKWKKPKHHSGHFLLEPFIYYHSPVTGTCTHRTLVQAQSTPITCTTHTLVWDCDFVSIIARFCDNIVKDTHIHTVCYTCSDSP